MREERVQRIEGGVAFPIIGRHAVGVIRGRDYIDLILEDLEESERATLNEAPEELLDLALELVRASARVESATATDSGRLDLIFEGGRQLVIEPDPEYPEAWNISGPGRLHVICGPGGGLALLDADSPSFLLRAGEEPPEEVRRLLGEDL